MYSHWLKESSDILYRAGGTRFLFRPGRHFSRTKISSIQTDAIYSVTLSQLSISLSLLRGTGHRYSLTRGIPSTLYHQEMPLLGHFSNAGRRKRITTPTRECFARACVFWSSLPISSGPSFFVLYASYVKPGTDRDPRVPRNILLSHSLLNMQRVRTRNTSFR